MGPSGGGFAFSGNQRFETTGDLSGSGTITFINLGGAGGRRLEFNSTNNTFTGGFVITRHDVRIEVNSLGGGNDIRFTNNGTFRYGSGAVADVTLGTIRLSGSGTIDNNSSHAMTINGDIIADGSGNKTLTLDGGSGPVNIFAGTIVDETDGGEGTVALTKSGSSTWVLSGINSYSGVTTVEAGTLGLNGDYSLPHEGTLNRTGGTIHIEGRARVADLQAGGVSLPAGIYGSTDSTAQFNGADLTRVDESTVANFFTGPGVLYVDTPFPPSSTLIVIL